MPPLLMMQLHFLLKIQRRICTLIFCSTLARLSGIFFRSPSAFANDEKGRHPDGDEDDWNDDRDGEADDEFFRFCRVDGGRLRGLRGGR